MPASRCVPPARLRPGVADTFDILAPEAARGFVATLSQRIGAAAAPISLMALIAAIVVVTNTVLVSVTERTRDIGVRRAVGARRDQIVREILAESVWLSLGGGFAGVTGGRAVDGRTRRGVADSADRVAVDARAWH